ncbi:hypothetical protein Cni_G10455 [Canna indica]|uniref:BAG domain-containing protein n=1 Tax=Canna indica TaxID=4628 RepID=A0AAQ3QAB8_9LILI|nr:hypothetical protein Cni_G10455 [Canna indica]
MEDPFFFDPWSSIGRRGRGVRDHESPFFYPADPWSAAPHRRYQSYRPEPAPEPVPTASPRPRVISVPVSFISSDGVPANNTKPARAQWTEAARSAAAVAIQRILRGHLVRKNVKVVSQVAVELGEVEQRVRSEEKRLRADEKERLRVNEMLMTLLFRLDSVRGIREYRKKVIRRVIALQEYLDSISAEIQGSTNCADNEARIPAEIQQEHLDSETVLQEAEEMPDNSHDKAAPEATTEQSMIRELQESDITIAEEVTPQEDTDPILDKDQVIDAVADEFESLDYTDDLKKQEDNESDDSFVVLSMEDATCTFPEASSKKALPFGPTEQRSGETATAVHAVEASEISTTSTMVEAATEEAGSQIAAAEAGNDSTEVAKSGIEEVMKKVMAECEWLHLLVAELCERNAEQCRLMAGLVDRVEHLERAVQRMEKKNKKRRVSLA